MLKMAEAVNPLNTAEAMFGFGVPFRFRCTLKEKEGAEK